MYFFSVHCTGIVFNLKHKFTTQIMKESAKSTWILLTLHSHKFSAQSCPVLRCHVLIKYLQVFSSSTKCLPFLNAILMYAIPTTVPKVTGTTIAVIPAQIKPHIPWAGFAAIVFCQYDCAKNIILALTKGTNVINFWRTFRMARYGRRNYMKFLTVIPKGHLWKFPV